MTESSVDPAAPRRPKPPTLKQEQTVIHFTVYVNDQIVKEGDLDDWMRVQIAKYLIDHPALFESDIHGKIVIDFDTATANFKPHVELQL